MSNFNKRHIRISVNKVFGNTEESTLTRQYLDAQDFSINTLKAVVQDLRKLRAAWFSTANNEPSRSNGYGTGCIRFQRLPTAAARSSCGDRQQGVGFFTKLLRMACRTGASPCQSRKEDQGASAATTRTERTGAEPMRRLLGKSNCVRMFGRAVFHLFLFTGCRIGDAVALELSDLMISERSGSVVFRLGKGGKQRTVPLPLPARRAIQAYLESRPPVQCQRLFLGERGALSDRGIRSLFDKYSAITGIKLHPHLLRHTMAHRYLADNNNDLVGLAQILGHESLNTTARYSQRTENQLAEASEKLNY